MGCSWGGIHLMRKKGVFDTKGEAGRGRAAYRGSLLYAMKYSSKRRLAAAAGGP